jgi:hypothetical protein
MDKQYAPDRLGQPSLWGVPGGSGPRNSHSISNPRRGPAHHSVRAYAAAFISTFKYQRGSMSTASVLTRPPAAPGSNHIVVACTMAQRPGHHVSPYPQRNNQMLNGRDRRCSVRPSLSGGPAGWSRWHGNMHADPENLGRPQFFGL